MRDAPQGPDAPARGFVLFVGLHNRKVAGDEREKIAGRPNPGAELSRQLRSKLVRKPRMFAQACADARRDRIPVILAVL